MLQEVEKKTIVGIKEGWQHIFGHDQWSNTLLGQSTATEHRLLRWSGCRGSIWAAFSHCVNLQGLHLLGKCSLTYCCQSPQDLMSQVSFRHKVQFHCMGPKLDATKQAKEGTAEKITASMDQISVKAGTMVWNLFFFLIS